MSHGNTKDASLIRTSDRIHYDLFSFDLILGLLFVISHSWGLRILL